MVGGGTGAGGTAPGEISGADSSRYTVGERIDYAAQTGTSVSSSSGVGYITVTPPQNPLPYKEPYTADNSGTQPSWTEYRVTVTVGGTPFSFTFAPGGTEAKVIDNVPTGTTLSAESEMDLADGAWGTGGAGTPLCAVAAPAVIQSGDNTITMYARYPLVCQMSSDAAGQGAAITGTAPTYYTNGSPTPLPAATESFVDGSGTTLRFAGWALSDGGTPVISGSVPSTGVYKGKLTLYATYSECTVSISTGAAGTDPILAEGETLALTAVPAGFPSAPTYTWSIESPAADAPVTVSASGVVSPVPGKSGGATVKVTATCGTLTATATQNVTVASLSVSGASAVEAMRLADGSKSVSAIVSGYTGTVEYSWTSSNSAVATVSPADTAAVTVAPLEGGITTLTVTAVLKDGSGTTIKVLPAKTVGVGVLELVLGGSGLPANDTDPVVLTSGSTETAALTAALRGIPSGVTYAWASGDTSLFTVSPANTSGTTVTPVAAGSDSVTATLTYKGVSVSASRNVSVAGIRLVLGTGSAVRVWDPVGSNALSLTVQPVGFAAVDSYTTTAYASDDTTVASVTATGGGSGMDVQFLKGGAVTVTAQAVYGGKTLTATKELAMLQLQLGGSGLPTGSNPIVLTAGSTETAALTATLVGLTADSWLWQSSDTAKFTVSTPATTAATTVTPVAAGSGTVTVKATYGGVDITASRNVSVAGITITGTTPYLWDATAASQTFDLSVESVGLPAGASVSYQTSLYSSSDTDVATFTTGGTPNGSTITVNAVKGGVTTITAKATYGGKTLTATKDITIIRLLVTYGSGTAVPDPADGTVSLADGPVTLTAKFEGLTTGVSYAWACTPATGSNISRSPASGASTTVSGTLGTATVTLTATYDGTDYTKDIGFDVVYCFDLADLRTDLASITGTSAANPVKIKLNAPLSSEADISTLKTALYFNSSVFVDLSEVTIAEGVSTVNLSDRSNLVVPPDIPSTVTSLSLSGTSIKDVSTLSLPDGLQTLYLGSCPGVTDLSALDLPDALQSLSVGPSLTSLTGVTLPSGLTTLSLYGNTNLMSLAGVTLPSTLTSLNLYGTTNLTSLAGVTLPSGLQTLNFRGSGLMSNLSALTIPNSVTTLTLGGDCLTSLTGLTLPASLTYSGFKEPFSNCDNLTDLTGLTGLSLPAGITSMYEWFEKCDGITNLDGVSIPNGITDLGYCFADCKGLVDAGGLTIPNSVTNMFGCFCGCTSLTTAPVIPSSASPQAYPKHQTLQMLFKGCTNLSGTITINAYTNNATEYSMFNEAFDGVDPAKIDKIKVPNAATRTVLLHEYPGFTGKVFIPGEAGYN